MEKNDKHFELKFIGREESKKLEQKIINKIGEDTDAVSFMNGKIIELLCYEVAITSMFLVFLFIGIFEKVIPFVIFSLTFVLLGISSVKQNISLINKLGKTQIKSKNN